MEDKKDKDAVVDDAPTIDIHALKCSVCGCTNLSKLMFRAMWLPRCKDHPYPAGEK